MGDRAVCLDHLRTPFARGHARLGAGSGLVARVTGTLAWRDTHLRIEGPPVCDLQLAFLEDWHFATGQAPSTRVHQGFAASLAATFQDDLKHAVEYRLRTARRASLWQRMSEATARLLSPLL